MTAGPARRISGRSEPFRVGHAYDRAVAGADFEPDDWADRHVARWRDHWVDVPFDEVTEAVLVRMTRIIRHLRRAGQESIQQAGLQDYEYATLHQLMVRDTPGQASPSELAADLGISGAGMTGRLDALERAGWIQRRASADDRRRIDIAVTKSGIEIWRKAMTLRSQVDDNLLSALSSDEQRTLAALLKKMAIKLEQ